MVRNSLVILILIISTVVYAARTDSDSSIIGTGDLRYLKLDCSNDPLTGDLNIADDIFIKFGATDDVTMEWDNGTGYFISTVGGASSIKRNFNTEIHTLTNFIFKPIGNGITWSNYAYQAAANLNFFRSQGSDGAETSIGNGNILHSSFVNAYHQNGNPAGAGAYYVAAEQRYTVDAPIGATAEVPTRWELLLAPDGSTTRQEVMQIASDKSVDFYSDVTTTLDSNDTVGLYIDGATNDFTTAGTTTIGINQTRDVNLGTGALANAAGIQNYLNPKHTNADITALEDFRNYAIINRIDNDATVNYDSIWFGRTRDICTYDWLDDDGTYDVTSTGSMFDLNYGNMIDMDYNGTFTDSGGTGGPASIVVEGLYIDIDSSPTLSSGTLGIQNNGIEIEVTGTDVGTQSVARGIFLDTVTGCDSNWGIYDISGADWLLGTDSQKLRFGSYNPSGDAYIEFDGDSLNIVANQVTATDDIELTADNIVCNGYIIPKSSTDASAPNNSIYYSTTQSKLVYKDSVGAVNVLY